MHSINLIYQPERQGDNVVILMGFSSNVDKHMMPKVHHL
jgi:hypothetical protein